MSLCSFGRHYFGEIYCLQLHLQPEYEGNESPEFFYQFTRRHIPKDRIFNINRSENLKFRMQS
jgi:hypothetical protein